MDTILRRAIEASEARKTAIFGGENEVTLQVGDSMQERALYSGYDIDIEELDAVADRFALTFSNMAAVVALGPLFKSAWCEGLLVGLMIASLPQASQPGADDDGTGQEVT